MKRITRLFLFVGDDTTHKRRVSVMKNGHQLGQLFLSKPQANHHISTIRPVSRTSQPGTHLASYSVFTEGSLQVISVVNANVMDDYDDIDDDDDDDDDDRAHCRQDRFLYLFIMNSYKMYT